MLARWRSFSAALGFWQDSAAAEIALKLAKCELVLMVLPRCGGECRGAQRPRRDTALVGRASRRGPREASRHLLEVGDQWLEQPLASAAVERTVPRPRAAGGPCKCVGCLVPPGISVMSHVGSMPPLPPDSRCQARSAHDTLPSTDMRHAASLLPPAFSLSVSL